MTARPSSLSVALGSRSYDIVIAAGLLERAGDYIAQALRRPRVIIVTDENVAPLYLAVLETALGRAQIRCQSIVLPAGEQTKSFPQLESLMETLLEMKPDRNTTLVALGGGVIGDITGFAASILLRGVDFIQIPTTLLAQVDSAVGGKTGINTRQGKNLVGSFYQPRLVLADTGALMTLPKRQLRAGYGEVVKYGLIADAGFFAWLEEHGASALAGDTAALAHIVGESCKAKAAIVAEDEREAGRRALLNFGHTLGHAFEAEAGFSDKLLHGEAVAIGMALAMRLSAQKGFCQKADCERVERHLRAAGLPVSPNDLALTWEVESIIAHCYHDKKALDGNLTFILAKEIGKTFISHEINRSDLEALLAPLRGMV